MTTFAFFFGNLTTEKKLPVLNFTTRSISVKIKPELISKLYLSAFH